MRYLSIVALLAFVIAGFVATGCEPSKPAPTPGTKTTGSTATTPSTAAPAPAKSMDAVPAATKS